ncbi:MAG: hypothetical protein FJ117_17595 [Deltaproteobacteria bacterium]|nr:hypothetical protein [Deltaproteobacteria bacterium]
MFRRKEVAWVSGIILTISVLIFPGCVAKWSVKEQTEIESRFLWTKNLPQNVLWVDVTPNGVIQVDISQNQGDNLTGKAQRYFLDATNGNVIWEGNIWAGHLITDKPSPVIVNPGEWKHSLTAFSLNGKLLWKKDYPGMYITGMSAPGKNLAITLAVDDPLKKRDRSLMGTLFATSLESGKVLWTAQIGPFQIADQTLGNLWRTIGNNFSLSGTNLYLLLDGTAYNIDLASGTVRWKQTVEVKHKKSAGDHFIWRFRDADAVVVNEGNIFRLSANGGVLWVRGIEDKAVIHDIQIIGSGIAFGYRSPEQEGAGLINFNSGELLWLTKMPREKSLFGNIKPSSLNGIGVADQKVFYAGYSKLYAVDLESGKKIFTADIPDKYNSLFLHKDHLILLAPDQVEARACQDGRKLWQRGPFASPFLKFNRDKKIAGGIMSAMMQASATVSNQMSATYGKMSRGKYEGGGNTMDVQSRMVFAKLSQSSGASGASAEFGKSLLGLSDLATPFSIEILTPWTAVPERNAFFLQIADTTSFYGIYQLAKLVMVDLDTGNLKDIHLPKAPSACIPHVLVDEIGNRIIEVYHKFPLCEGAKRIDVLMLKK